MLSIHIPQPWRISHAKAVGMVGVLLLGTAVWWGFDMPRGHVLQPAAVSTVGKGLNGPLGKQSKAVVHLADFGGHVPSPQARYLADWIADSHDNHNSDFIMVDKQYATLYVFDAQARLRALSPVLLGAALGDDSVPGIGSRPLAQVRPEERTTPAGRFLAERGHNARGEDVVWVDYNAAVSMHRVLRTHPQEHRLERLASNSLEDKRISWGCINVPVAFFENSIRPLFASQRALVYVLPDMKPVQEVFSASYDVEAA